MFTSDRLLCFMFVPGKSDGLLTVRGVLLLLPPALRLALLGLLQVRAGDAPVALRPQHLSAPLLSSGTTAGAAGAPISPGSDLAVVH